MSCFSLPNRVALLVPAVLAAAASCTVVGRPKGTSPLKPPQMSPDSCAVDIFFVRFPFGDRQANGPLWAEIDEQHFPTDLRRRLARDGFRVGLVGGQIPLKLARMLKLTDQAPPPDLWQHVRFEDLESAPTVVQWHLPLRAGRRREIVASGVYDEMPVLLSDGQSVCGESYPAAQGILGLKAFPESGGRVRLELVPEVHYGQDVPRFVPGQGGFVRETGRPRRVFDDLAVSATLAPGEMLVMTGLPNRPGRLGHRFFTRECSGLKEQKLLVIRLSQIQHDDLFSSHGVPAPEDGESAALSD